ncbi:MAG TPA: MBL fold metallo-hydrolase [Nocardioides sp.]|uniref:MBL fold metallo-hydrolase n=1 Tax=Nocardioides sp. TaxID=35761 RepID=UPI002E2EFD09|nr:MBL fold metallo-hydrolase [Nocardioides sp.]HEX5090438.1 MBL fold metallo-hydrolase [Nocardioides sp.]
MPDHTGPERRTVGGFEVIALEDAAGPFMTSREEAFPDATAAQWADADAFDPAARTAAGEWWLRFRSFAVRRGDGPVTLVDAGVGPVGAPASDWAPVPGRLPDELAAAGIRPADVTAIVLTHLHSDHLGWAVPGGSPFVEARVVVPRADVAAWTVARPDDDPLVAPLRAQDRLEVVEGDVALAPGLRLVATPGHTPGHQSVLVEDSLLLAGDLLVHAVQLQHPELAYAYEADPELARRSRQRWLERDVDLAPSHLGRAFVRP